MPERIIGHSNHLAQKEIAIASDAPLALLEAKPKNPAFFSSRVVVGMTIVDGYPASLTRSDCSSKAGRSLFGLVFMRGLKSIMYKCPRLMGTYLPRFARATPAMNSSLFSSRSAAAQRFTESRISRRSFSSWLFFSKVLRAVRISPDLVAIPVLYEAFRSAPLPFLKRLSLP